MILRDSSSLMTTAIIAAISGASLTYLLMRNNQQDDNKYSQTSTTSRDDDEKRQQISSSHDLNSSIPKPSFGRQESSNLNSLNPILQTAGRAKQPRTAKTYYRNQPNATHVIRICLTGGPCAGKSSALNEIRLRATAAGFDVYCAPESATLFLNSGVGYPKSPQQQYCFQKSICVLQLALERTLTRIVQGTGRPSIIIFDRGLMDTKGYVPSEAMWQQILSELSTSEATDDGEKSGVFTMGVTEDYCLRRYDGVVHLVTAAEGASQHYKSGEVTDDNGQKVVRNETLEEAIHLDHAMRKAWSAHRHHYVIDNRGGFQEKLDATVKVILRLAEETHPSESIRARKSILVK